MSTTHCTTCGQPLRKMGPGDEGYRCPHGHWQKDPVAKPPKKKASK